MRGLGSRVACISLCPRCMSHRRSRAYSKDSIFEPSLLALSLARGALSLVTGDITNEPASIGSLQ